MVREAWENEAQLSSSIVSVWDKSRYHVLRYRRHMRARGEVFGACVG